MRLLETEDVPPCSGYCISLPGPKKDALESKQKPHGVQIAAPSTGVPQELLDAWKACFDFASLSGMTVSLIPNLQWIGLFVQRLGWVTQRRSLLCSQQWRSCCDQILLRRSCCIAKLPSAREVLKVLDCCVPVAVGYAVRCGVIWAR